MTLQSLRKLRTTLRKTYFNNNNTCQTLSNGLLSLAILFGASSAVSFLTMDQANAQSWQGRNAQQTTAQAAPAQTAPAPSAANGYVEPVVMPISMDRTTVKTAEYNQTAGEGYGIQLVGYSASVAPQPTNKSLKWSAPNQNAQVYRAARQPQTMNPADNGYVQQVSGEALSDPFGDRRSGPRRGAAYGTGVPTAPTAPVTMPAPGAAPEFENPPTLPNNAPSVPGTTDLSAPNLSELNGTSDALAPVEPAPMGDVPALDTAAPSLDAGIPSEPEAPALQPINPGEPSAPNLEGLDAPAPTALENGSNGAESMPTENVPAVNPSRSSQNSAGSQLGRPNQNLLNTFRVPGTTDDNLARARKMEENCPPVSSLKPIGKISNDITPTPGEFPNECTLGDDVFAGRNFAPIRYTWTAPNTCNNPLYFEDENLERYGHSWGPIMQPIMSAGHFALTVPCLPWLMAIDPPNECVYTLGYYRPGNCAPYMFDPLPYSVRAAFVEGGIATALVFLIP